jgi:hypothetical protein
VALELRWIEQRFPKAPLAPDHLSDQKIYTRAEHRSTDPIATTRRQSGNRPGNGLESMSAVIATGKEGLQLLRVEAIAESDNGSLLIPLHLRP